VKPVKNICCLCIDKVLSGIEEGIEKISYTVETSRRINAGCCGYAFVTMGETVIYTVGGGKAISEPSPFCKYLAELAVCQESES
jgi:hypothetical protein